ncbi:glycosyltransferase family 8 protein [Phytohabitans kaempferiae]|uniref:Glycosyltransferase family 8 protein n=1 Tax=Phytohabitans kaempferiae TaxID=1620943 RepID=A0ABV6MBY7_9ACTN
MCGIDDTYVVPFCALATSVAAAHPDPATRPRMIVLHHALSPSSCRAVATCGEQLGLELQLRRVTVDHEARLPVTGWASPAVYLRLAIPQSVDDEPVVLYLDADTLVLRDLGPLLRQPLDGAPVAAVRDPQNPIVGTGIALPGCERIGVPAGREYFNSGVMLLDLVACAELGVFERARRFLVDWPDEVQLWDQDALNVAVDDRWQRLDRCWNTFAMSALAAQPGFFHHTAEPVMPLADLLADEYTAAVLHFAGPVKPWHDAFAPVPLRRLYRRFLPAPVLAGAR